MVTNDELLITYSATLNASAAEASLNGEKQSNNAWLGYGEDHTTSSDKVTVTTYGFEIVKTDDQKTLLDGAVFMMYDDDPYVGGVYTPSAAPIELVKCTTTGGETYYRRALSSDPAGDITTEIEVTNGRIKIVGLDDSTYWLYEKEQPAGYNELGFAKSVFISNGDQYATFDSSGNYVSGGVWIINNKGDRLPTTGGMGTTLFITGGSIVALGAGLLLVTKKRMSMIQE